MDRTDFNHDFRVSFSEEEIKAGTVDYNFGVNVPMGDCRGVGCELANDLLQDVFQRNQAFDVTVFVDYECEASPVALELRELDG